MICLGLPQTIAGLKKMLVSVFFTMFSNASSFVSVVKTQNGLSKPSRTLQKTDFKRYSVEKEEIAGQQHFLLFLQYFLSRIWLDVIHGLQIVSIYDKNSDLYRSMNVWSLHFNPYSAGTKLAWVCGQCRSRSDCTERTV